MTASFHVEVDCPNEPDQVTEGMARAALAPVIGQIQATIASDPRFGEPLDRFGCVYEYVHEYGMGGVLVAVGHGDGDLELQSP